MKFIVAFRLVTFLGLISLPAYVESATPYPDVVDTSHAEPETAAFFRSFFSAKSLKDLEGTMAHFSPNMLTYTDATLGWNQDSQAAVRKVLGSYMPKWGKGLSYPTRILGGTTHGTGSAIVEFTDTPELFGGELRIVGAVDFVDGKIVRWVDYWDSSSYDSNLYHQLRTPKNKFPTDFKESAITQPANKRINSVAIKLLNAFNKGEEGARAHIAAALFTHDAVFEDMAIRTQIRGQEAIERYFNRILSVAPFAKGAKLRHIVGSNLGGGFEWDGSPLTAVRTGITTLTLDKDDKIIQAAVMYDGRLLGKRKANDLRLLVAEPWESSE